MSKEWEKFQSEYKKLQPKIAKYSKDEASAARNRVNSANTNAGEGERHLADSMVTARKNGVTGDTLQDFMKDKGFAEAYTLLKTSLNDMAKELVAMESFSKEAMVVHGEVTKLDAAITKDLKDRKDKSATKKDIEGLQAKLAEDLKTLKEAGGKWALVEPLKRNRPANFTKTVATILKQAPEVQAARQEAVMLPQLLVDRKIKHNLSRAVTLAKSIADDCGKAIEVAGDDMKAALSLVKGAGEALKELTGLNGEYQKLLKDHKKVI